MSKRVTAAMRSQEAGRSSSMSPGSLPIPYSVSRAPSSPTKQPPSSPAKQSARLREEAIVDLSGGDTTRETRDDSRVVYTSLDASVDIMEDAVAASKGLEGLVAGVGVGATGYTRWLERKQSLEERPTDWRRVLLQ